MDNQNNTTDPNNPTPNWLPAQPTPPQPDPIPAQPEPFPSAPIPEPTPPVEPIPPAPALDSSFTPQNNYSEPTWTPPAQPEPSFPPPVEQPNLVSSEPAPISQNQPPLTWAPPATPPPASGPTPTFTPPQPEEKPDQSTVQPSWMTTPDNTPQSQESVPTDLSHLISNNNPVPEPVQPSPDTLVIPQTNNNPEAPNSPAENHHKGIPRWLISLGVGLLIVVIGASAYFILGIGQPKTTTSVPAEVAPQKAEVKLPPPIPTIPPAQPASGSANFGQLEGSGGGGTEQATSAADLIRQRQQ